MKGQLGFFDLDERYAQLSKSGDPLERGYSFPGIQHERNCQEPFLKRHVGVMKARSNRDTEVALTPITPVTPLLPG